MKAVNTHEAKTNFSRLLRRVALGEEIVIANRGVPVARLVPPARPTGERKLGAYAGQIWMAEDFDGSLPEDLLDAFEDRRKRSKKKK
jgi:prevent-host-death family protein